jgi:hypothetical protein
MATTNLIPVSLPSGGLKAQILRTSAVFRVEQCAFMWQADRTSLEPDQSERLTRLVLHAWNCASVAA